MGLTFPAMIIILSAIIEPVVAFARVSSAFPNNSMALSLKKKSQRRKKGSSKGKRREIIMRIKPSYLWYIRHAHAITLKTPKIATVKYWWHQESLRLALMWLEKEFCSFYCSSPTTVRLFQLDQGRCFRYLCAKYFLMWRYTYSLNSGPSSSTVSTVFSTAFSCKSIVIFCCNLLWQLPAVQTSTGARLWPKEDKASCRRLKNNKKRKLQDSIGDIRFSKKLAAFLKSQIIKIVIHGKYVTLLYFSRKTMSF